MSSAVIGTFLLIWGYHAYGFVALGLRVFPFTIFFILFLNAAASWSASNMCSASVSFAARDSGGNFAGLAARLDELNQVLFARDMLDLSHPAAEKFVPQPDAIGTR